MKRFPKWLKWLLSIIGGLVLLIAVALLIVHESRPEGQTGPEADALARKMLQAVNKEAWDSTGIVRWNFNDMHQYIWDKDRHWTIVEWGEHRAMFDINAIKGRAWKGGAELEGSAAEKIVRKAWEYWCNDSFWLNAPVKAFDPGTSRSIVNQEDGSQALMVSYGSGGVTPGDSYLWILDENGLPKAWKMWVKIIPFGGLEFSWENWKEVKGGARLAQLHNSSLFPLNITDIEAARDWQGMGMSADPFAPIVGK
ncbi:MAG: hypothetical protein AAFV95_22260 [Bacteroidota bacterium]